MALPITRGTGGRRPMLFVMLSGLDPEGWRSLLFRNFRSLQDLARFVATDSDWAWDSCKVLVGPEELIGRVYLAAELQSLAGSRDPGPSEN